MMRKEAVILTGGLALIGAYYFSQREGEKSKGDNQFLTGGGYIPKKMTPSAEPLVEPTSSNITYNIQFPELNIPQYTPSFTSEPSPMRKKERSFTTDALKKEKKADIKVNIPKLNTSTGRTPLHYSLDALKKEKKADIKVRPNSTSLNLTPLRLLSLMRKKRSNRPLLYSRKKRSNRPLLYSRKKRSNRPLLYSRKKRSNRPLLYSRKKERSFTTDALKKDRRIEKRG